MANKAANSKIDYKQAGEIALKYLQQMISDATDIRLEEVEKSLHGSEWQVTYGYKSSEASEPISGLFGRKFKKVSIDAETGELISIKSRIAG